MAKIYPDNQLDVSWVNGNIPISQEAIEWVSSFGKYLSTKDGNFDPLTTSQLRKFFGELKRIQADFEKAVNEVPLLKAKLAYAVGRDFSDKKKNYQTKLHKFYEQLKLGIDEVEKTQDLKEKKIRFSNFVKIVEATVAFHKYFEAENLIANQKNY